MADPPRTVTRRTGRALGRPVCRWAAVALFVAGALLPARPGAAQCAGDCDADGQTTVGELVTMITVALGAAPVGACPVGDAGLDGAITIDEITGALHDALDDCALRRSFDFRAGAQGWEADFADYAPHMREALELVGEPRPLPAGLGLDGTGFLLSGFNQSDDLWMALFRRLGPADGLVAGRAYWIDYTLVVASAAGSGCAGVGGSPGESVYLKAGAADAAPATVLDPTDGYLRTTVAKGNQSTGGPQASLIGDVANGLPCETGNGTFVSLRRTHRHPHPVTATAAAELWLVLGTDSAFEGVSSLYYQRVEVRLTPVDALHLNDVSILVPLPAADDLEALLAPQTAGAHGALLAPARYAALPRLHVFQSPEETYARLRVVALRLDPCFLTDAMCRRQLRLTMQPLSVDPFDGAVRADDAAVHLFYDLAEPDFAALVDALRAATAAAATSTAGPLRVHPILAQEGPRGAFAAALRDAVLQAAGDQTLSRITFMQLQNFNVNEWVFGGFEVDGAALLPIDIIDAGSTRQRFINVILASEEDFVASVDPPALGTDDHSLLFNSDGARGAGEAAVAAAERAALRIENPDVHSTETVSCVACHTATPARLWTERALGRDSAGHPDRYTAAADLTLTSETTRVPGSLRAFGYLHRRVAISQRTVNESAAVAAALNAPSTPAGR